MLFEICHVIGLKFELDLIGMMSKFIGGRLLENQNIFESIIPLKSIEGGLGPLEFPQTMGMPPEA